MIDKKQYIAFFSKIKKCVEKYKKCDIIIIGDTNG